jgi:hypothetical protein
MAPFEDRPSKPSLPQPLSPRGREGRKTKNRAPLLVSLLSPWERRGRGGEGFGGHSADPFPALRERRAGVVRASA